MGLIAKTAGGSTFEPTPAGLHLGICYQIIDLGTHHDLVYAKDIHKVLITWELPNERIDIDGKLLPRAISKKYTLSLSEKAHLRHDLESWRGKAFTAEELEGFDLKNVLGAPCQLQVIHTEKGDRTYANVGSIVQAPKGTIVEPENPLTFFSFEDWNGKDEPTLPEWIMKQLKESKEWYVKKNDNIPPDVQQRHKPEEPESPEPIIEENYDDLPF